MTHDELEEILGGALKKELWVWGEGDLRKLACTLRPLLAIETLKTLQSELGLGAYHMVEIREDGFSMAHSDAERAARADTPLESCSLHLWLCAGHGIRMVPAIYVCRRRIHAKTADPGYDFDRVMPTLKRTFQSSEWTPQS